MSETNTKQELNEVMLDNTENQISKQLRAFFADGILVWFLLWCYNNFPFYTAFLTVESKNILLILGFAHLFFMWPLYLNDKKATSYGVILWQVLIRLFQASTKLLSPKNVPNFKDIKKIGWFVSEQEKVSLLALLVKMIFIPLIIGFTVGNLQVVSYLLEKFNWEGATLSISFFNDSVYELILRTMFLVDTLCFLLGYLTDLDGLDNHIKSVEPTWFGWIVALACYPPFNSVTGQFLPSYGNDMIFFWNENLTFLLRIIILILFGIYTWASIALGPKASNLTNRGIIAHGPYKYVRHPAYISKTLVWFLCMLPIASFYAVFSTLGVMFLYFLRAITEERHLLADPDYVAYAKKVKFKFIPYVY